MEVKAFVACSAVGCECAPLDDKSAVTCIGHQAQPNECFPGAWWPAQQKAAQEKAAQEKAIREKLALEQAARQKAARERALAAERHAAEKKRVLAKEAATAIARSRTAAQTLDSLRRENLILLRHCEEVNDLVEMEKLIGKARINCAALSASRQQLGTKFDTFTTYTAHVYNKPGETGWRTNSLDTPQIYPPPVH